MNILTFDIEEWFHLLENESSGDVSRWGDFPVRIHENVDRLLEILSDTDTKATFFIIGWIAEKYPEVVRKIAERYEIGSHTMRHELVWARDRETFRNDLSSSVKLLEDVSGKQVKYFRAPGFSIRESEPWAFEVIHECGIEIDCSVFPAHHAHGGIESYGKAEPSIIECNGVRIKELPVGFHTAFGKNIIYSGGGYFRLLPYGLIKKWTREEDYVMSYIHPRDLDKDQPRLEGLSAARRFKAYVGISGAEKKLRQWLTDFEFTDIAEADRTIKWDEVPVFKFG
jgi:polysaccharide deacetylase family protein (PEP-CTERM system associated)